MLTRGEQGKTIGRLGVALLLLLLGIGSVLPAIAQSPTNGAGDQDVFIPLIESGEGSAATSSVTPIATPSGIVTTGSRVYGLLGKLEQPNGQEYSYYLSTANSGYFALAGETPEVEQKIEALAIDPNTENVKVWGELQPANVSSEPPLIVVTGILGTEVAMPTAVVGESVPVAVVKFDAINLYAGPASTFGIVGQVVRGQACEVTGRNQPSSWLQLTCGDGQQGWVDARLVDVQGALAGVIVINTSASTPVPTAAAPTTTPTPSPVVFSGWRTELYNNATLSGSPVAVVDVPNLSFNWGNGGPSQVGDDAFSIRFSRRVTVTPAYYQFTAVADDGIRVWVDGRLLINAWPADPSQSYVAGQVLTGSHDILVEYYEQSGLANVRLDYAPTLADSGWQASYYYGVTPSGNPAFSQQEARGTTPLDYNWSTGAPQSAALGANVLGNDYWSARWQGEFPFETGNFVFRANVDDGIRLYLDGLLVIDQWRDGYKETSNRVIGIGAGQHTMAVEYYERTGNASIEVWWYRDSAYTGPQ